jgi:hypothetical protein
MSASLLRPVNHAPEPREVYLEWQEQAACRPPVDPEIFFPEKGGSYAEALKICKRCPVLDQCRRWTDRVEGNRWVHGLFGMYGGETPGERVARRVHEQAVA